jgi:hypothetical protein
VLALHHPGSGSQSRGLIAGECRIPGTNLIAVERATWTDERLDDMARTMNSGFGRMDRDIRELRAIMITFGGGIIVGLIGVIGAIIATS